MSSAALSWATAQVVRPAAAKLLLMVMADHANPSTGEIFPSVARLCLFTSLNRKTVISGVQRLIDMGIVKVGTGRRGETGQIKVYHLNREWGGESIPLRVPKTDRKSPENGTAKESRFRDTEPSNKEPSRKEDIRGDRGSDPEPGLFGDDLPTGPTLETEIVEKYAFCWDKLSDGIPTYSKPNAITINARSDMIVKRVLEWSGERKRESVEQVLETLFSKLARSHHLQGINDRGWVASFSWVLEKNNFLKIMEGDYDRNRKPDGPMGSGSSAVVAGQTALQLLRNRKNRPEQHRG